MPFGSEIFPKIERLRGERLLAGETGIGYIGVCLLLRSGISVSRVQRQLSSDAQEYNPTAIRNRRLMWNSRRWRRVGQPTKTAVFPSLCISNKRRARLRVGGIRLSGAVRDGRAGLIRGPSASLPVNGGFATRNPRKLQRLCKVLKRPLL